MELLNGKVALVTGGAQGQGRAEAELFAEHGATVVVSDIVDDVGEEVADSIVDDGGRAVYHPLDVSAESEWEALVETIEADYGGLDVLVNNAGVIRPDSITEETVDGWQQVIDVDLKGAWLGMKHAIPFMAASGGGSVVNISSIYGIAGGLGDCASYHAAKGGVTVLTRNAAVGYAPAGVRVNSVHPGVMTIPMGHPDEKPSEHTPSQEHVDMTPQGRAGTPEDIAGAVLFLASDLASFVNGVTLPVDGGYLAR